MNVVTICEGEGQGVMEKLARDLVKCGCLGPSRPSVAPWGRELAAETQGVSKSYLEEGVCVGGECSKQMGKQEVACRREDTVRISGRPG